MSRRKFVVGKIKQCSDHFHVEFECPGCREIGPGPANNTRFEMVCSDTGQKYIVVGFPLSDGPESGS
jgi:hypothetical protein